MARKIPLCTFGVTPQRLKEQFEAKVAAGDLDANAFVMNTQRTDPWFDYAEELAAVVSSPLSGRNGNSSQELRTINRITNIIDRAKESNAPAFILEESEYNFLAARVAGFANWANISPALNRLIERMIDCVANAETVDLNNEALPSKFYSVNGAKALDFADCIRTGQVSHEDAVKIMAENPEFAAWYKQNYIAGKDESGQRRVPS